MLNKPDPSLPSKRHGLFCKLLFIQMFVPQNGVCVSILHIWRDTWFLLLFSLMVTYKLMNNLHLHCHQKYFRNHKRHSNNSVPKSQHLNFFVSLRNSMVSFFLLFEQATFVSQNSHGQVTWSSPPKALFDNKETKDSPLYFKPCTIFLTHNRPSLLQASLLFPGWASPVHSLISHNTISCPFSILLTPLRAESMVSVCSDRLP